MGFLRKICWKRRDEKNAGGNFASGILLPQCVQARADADAGLQKRDSLRPVLTDIALGSPIAYNRFPALRIAAHENVNRPVRHGDGAAGPIEIAELRLDPERPPARGDGAHAEDALRQENGGRGGPCVAEAARVFFFAHFERLPAGVRPAVEHFAPVAADDGERVVRQSGVEQRLEREIQEERRAYHHDVAARLAGNGFSGRAGGRRAEAVEALGRAADNPQHAIAPLLRHAAAEKGERVCLLADALAAEKIVERKRLLPVFPAELTVAGIGVGVAHRVDVRAALLIPAEQVDAPAERFSLLPVTGGAVGKAERFAGQRGDPQGADEQDVVRRDLAARGEIVVAPLDEVPRALHI